MRKKPERTLAAICLILSWMIWPISGRAYQIDEAATGKWVIKQPTSPLTVTVSSNREYYSLNNYSSKRIVAYRLGCVNEKNGKVKVTAKAKTRLVDIAPLDKDQNRAYGKAYTIYADEDFYPCIEMKTKLAVLEVRFSDSSKWSAKF